jgi:hypothetical protein
MTHKKRKKKFHVLNCWMFFFGAEGFSCSLGVLYRGLGKSKLQFNTIFHIKNPIFPALNFSQFLVIKTLDPELDPNPHPDPQLEKMLDPHTQGRT